MQRIDILVTSEPRGGSRPFAHDDVEVRFHAWAGDDRLPLLEGSAWAFVDWNSAQIEPVEACRRLRCEPLTALSTVVMVMAEESAENRRRGLRAGADDFLVGPFDRHAMLDYVLLRMEPGQSPVAQNAIQLGKLTINTAGFQVRWNGKLVPMMPNEFRLLRFLAQHSNRVFTRAQLIAALGKQEPPIDERTVDAWVVRLRRAFRSAGAPEMLRTVRSLGYVFDAPD